MVYLLTAVDSGLGDFEVPPFLRSLFKVGTLVSSCSAVGRLSCSDDRPDIEINLYSIHTHHYKEFPLKHYTELNYQRFDESISQGTKEAAINILANRNHFNSGFEPQLKSKSVSHDRRMVLKNNRPTLPQKYGTLTIRGGEVQTWLPSRCRCG